MCLVLPGQNPQDCTVHLLITSYIKNVRSTRLQKTLYIPSSFVCGSTLGVIDGEGINDFKEAGKLGISGAGTISGTVVIRGGIKDGAGDAIRLAKRGSILFTKETH